MIAHQRCIETCTFTFNMLPHALYESFNAVLFIRFRFVCGCFFHIAVRERQCRTPSARRHTPLVLFFGIRESGWLPVLYAEALSSYYRTARSADSSRHVATVRFCASGSGGKKGWWRR